MMNTKPKTVTGACTAKRESLRPVWEIFANPLPLCVCLNAAWIAQNGEREAAGAYIRQAEIAYRN